MTYNPTTLRDLGTYWTKQGGVNLGVVGDVDHQQKGTSYHLGKSSLKPDAYSIRTARDKAGLTEAASAIDLGKLDGRLADLRDFSMWLVKQAQKNLPGTSDMREIIYSPDGKVVMRWDRERGYASTPRAGEADNSHLTHTHISWYRDAEKRDHTTAFRPYFVEEVKPMPGLQFRILDRVDGTVTVKGDGHALIRVDTGAHVPVPAGQQREVAARIVLTQASTDGKLPSGTKGYLVGNIPGATPDASIAAMLLEVDVTFTPVAGPPPATVLAPGTYTVR